jgi:hypothetical protein
LARRSVRESDYCKKNCQSCWRRKNLLVLMNCWKMDCQRRKSLPVLTNCRKMECWRKSLLGLSFRHLLR